MVPISTREMSILLACPSQPALVAVPGPLQVGPGPSGAARGRHPDGPGPSLAIIATDFINLVAVTRLLSIPLPPVQLLPVDQRLDAAALSYTHIFVCMYVYMCMCIYISTHAHPRTYARTHTHTPTRLCTCRTQRPTAHSPLAPCAGDRRLTVDWASRTRPSLSSNSRAEAGSQKTQ